jgi:hypothetical protein
LILHIRFTVPAIKPAAGGEKGLKSISIQFGTVTESDGKKLYAITAGDGEYLAANKAALDHALPRMQSVNRAHRGGPAPEIMRAKENLNWSFPCVRDAVH